jgi:hypothetical protein
VAGVCLLTHLLHYTYVFLVTRATKDGKIVNPAVSVGFKHRHKDRKKTRVVYQIGIFRSVSVGNSRYYQYQYQRISRSVFLVSKLWREPLKKLAGAPFFLRRGGLGPLFVHFALLLKKKRNSRRIFQKKSSCEFFKRCSRQNLQYNNTDRNTESPANLIPAIYRYQKNCW